MKGMNSHEKVSQSLARLHPVDRIGTVPPWWGRRPVGCEVTEMEGFANLISMMDYVLDTRRKRHITGGILLSAALLFGGLAITVMSIKDEQIIEAETEDEEYE